MELLFLLVNSSGVYMKFDIIYSNTPVGGLKFQITKISNNMIDFHESIIIDEEVFSLIEKSFSNALNSNSEQYKYYHWGKHFHYQADIEKIIQNLNNLKNMVAQHRIGELNYFWLDDNNISFLKENNHLFVKLINDIITFLDKNKYGICVIGI